MHKWIIGLAICALSVCSQMRSAEAQSGINRVNILTFEPSTSPYGILTTDTAKTQGSWKWYVGAYFGYAYDPFRAIIRDTQPVHSFVHHHVPADLVASIGIWKYFELGLHLPFVLYQEPKGDRDPLGMGDPAIRKAAVGDLRIVPKVRFWKNTSHGFGLAFIAQFTVPTGFEKDNAGEQFLTFEPKVVADYTFKQGTVIALNTGMRVRKRTDIIRLRIAHQFYYSLGADINVYRRRVSVLAELFGAVGFSDAPGDPTKALDPEEAPLELLAAVRYRAPFGLILTGGAGVGLTDGWSSPAFRVFLGVGFSPVPKRPDKDTDGDGLVDRVDKCPLRPEDKDGFEDTDGCPDPDDDKDGICDENPEIQKHLDWHRSRCTGKDLCPRRPEDKDRFEDTDGCPDPDNDQDGVPDATDKCRATDADKKDGFAQTREDRDGHADTDGCPDPDNDKDKICDNNDSIQKSVSRWTSVCKGSDKCPDKPENYNGFEDEDGCPDSKPVVRPVIPRTIQIGERAHFAKSRWWIGRGSAKALKVVAKLLIKHKNLKLVEIAGHADERGSDAYNLIISQNRAKAVRWFLMRNGVSGKRLVAKGYGRTDPVVPGCRSLSTIQARKQCWRKNRRVVFTVLKRDP